VTVDPLSADIVLPRRCEFEMSCCVDVVEFDFFGSRRTGADASPLSLLPFSVEACLVLSAVVLLLLLLLLLLLMTTLFFLDLDLPRECDLSIRVCVVFVFLLRWDDDDDGGDDDDDTTTGDGSPTSVCLQGAMMGG